MKSILENNNPQIEILASDTYWPEKEYICCVIFNEFLKVDYRLVKKKPSGSPTWTIKGRLGVITMPDLFLDLYTSKGLPLSVPYLSFPLLFEDDIPAIYTDGDYHCTEKSYRIPIDLFASSFFMLSRWEEALPTAQTVDGRTPSRVCISKRDRFTTRPIVNEYVELLKNHLEITTNSPICRVSSFQLIPTHDIDMIDFGKLKRFAGDLIKHHSLRRFKFRFKCIDNPWDNFDWLMDLSDSANTVSRFYFMSGGTTRFDNDYTLKHPRLKKIVQNVIQRNHVVGFHPSYSTAKSPKQWKKEKQHLEEFAGINVKEGRQHYLRWYHCDTPRFWDANGMNVDSSLGFYDLPGYRCGTGNEFTLFDLTERQPLSLKERPLVFMDTTIKRYLQSNAMDAYNCLETLKAKAIRYRMPFTILFHNSSFDELSWPGWKEMYENFIT